MKRITVIKEPIVTRKKLKVAAYCRVSTSMDDQLVSLQAQKTHYENYIKSNPEWAFAGIYYDEGITGTKMNKRPALLKLLEDCEHGLVNYIVTKSVSRFARNTVECLEMVRRLMRVKVPIFFEEENINTSTMGGEFLLTIMGSIAENDSLSISQNEKWSIEKRYLSGTFKCGTTPYGYNWDPEHAKMIINETEAPIVRWIFEQTISGKGSRELARELEGKGIPTRKGGRWTGQTITVMLQNEKYTGDILFQKTYTDSNFCRHKNHGEVKKYLCENHHEAIVSREVFELAQETIRKRALEKGIHTGDRKYLNRYPLSGKIICGECGHTFKRRVHYAGKPNEYIAWCCSEHLHDSSKCSMKFIKNEEIEEAFVRMINDLIINRKKMLQPLFKKNDKEPKTDKLMKRLENIDREKQTLNSLKASGVLELPVFLQEYNKLIKEEQELLAQKKSSNGNDEREFDALQKLVKFTEHAKPIDKFDGDLFSEYVEKITIKSRAEIEFELKCGLKITENMIR